MAAKVRPHGFGNGFGLARKEAPVATDMQRVMEEAQRAREEVEAATRRAQEMEAQVEVARERSRQEREARQREWAQRTVDSYESQLSEADVAVQKAQSNFDAAAATDLAAAHKAYLAWGEAASRHYAMQVRIGVAAPLVGFEATTAEPIQLPQFSQAIDAALQRQLAELSDRARDETAAELKKLVGDDDTATANPS